MRKPIASCVAVIALLTSCRNRFELLGVTRHVGLAVHKRLAEGSPRSVRAATFIPKPNPGDQIPRPSATHPPPTSPSASKSNSPLPAERVIRSLIATDAHHFPHRDFWLVSVTAILRHARPARKGLF